MRTLLHLVLRCGLLASLLVAGPAFAGMQITTQAAEPMSLLLAAGGLAGAVALRRGRSHRRGSAPVDR